MVRTVLSIITYYTSCSSLNTVPAIQFYKAKLKNESV